jgi:hypothetical protein
MGSRQEVLVSLVQKYETELATAWACSMPMHRVRALKESLDSARKELTAILRAEEKANAKDVGR